MQVWFLRNRFTIGAGVALFIVFTLVLSQFGGASQTSATQQTMSPGNPWFWLAALVLLAGAGASFANRGGAPARWALGILIIILGLKFVSGIVFGEKAVEVEQNVRNGMANAVLGKTPQEKGDIPSATTSAQATKQEAKWERLADGSIPVGVWSETFTIEVGCKTFYDAGIGTDFNVRYRFYTNEWTALKPDTYPPANEVQFILLKPRKVVPIKVTCS